MRSQQDTTRQVPLYSPMVDSILHKENKPVSPIDEPVLTTLNTNAPDFVPSAHQSFPVKVPTSSPDGIINNPLDPTSEITKFLLRKDLLFSRLTTFNDRPESYFVWKASFKCVINDLQVSDSEQLDLLVKWLGVDSSKHAISIRASNADNPTRGLQRLWQRLDERYGAPEMVEASLKTKLSNFPKLTNKDSKRLYELSDILSEIEYIKENPVFQNLLGYFDSSSGIKPIVNKLPYGLQEKWTTRAVRYIETHCVPFPPFTEFSAFIRQMSQIRNNPGFSYDSENQVSAQPGPWKLSGKSRDRINVNKVDVKQKATGVDTQITLDRCIHHKTKHSLDDCRGFRSKTLEERKKLLKQNNVCFKCCASNTHKSRDCKETICCKECRSKYHTTALHILRPNHPLTDSTSSPPHSENGGEANNIVNSNSEPSTHSKCTEICTELYSGKSCAKILPVKVYHKDNRDKVIRLYAIIDDQSNRSLVTSKFFDVFDVHERSENYTLSTCAGKVATSGRRARGFIIESIQGDVRFDLPVLIECNQVPSNREEIPTPEVTLNYPHLREITENISPVDDDCHILLLIGRDLIEAHHVIRQIFGPPKAPFAQQLKLGWVVIGETCLDRQHAPIRVEVNKTYLLPSGQATIMKPCENKFDIRETVCPCKVDGSELFVRTKDDNKPGMSIEDRMFLKQMDNEFIQDSSGNWVAPLPFRPQRQRLPDNREQAVQRAKLLDASLKKNSAKKEHFLKFMSKILDNDHAEVAPPLHDNEERWYLPLFGVYHPKKLDQIRGVFDSSALFKGISLNKVLLSGPDLSNSLLGILLRFRKEMIAVTADVEHMFHCFVVREDHRNYLRFLWHEDNDFDKDLIEYRMKKHVFGNSPSPAVATLGLRKTAQKSELEYGSHVTEFVSKNFYVDDGLLSCSTIEEAIKTVKDTRDALKKYGNLRLHKFASNSSEVMSAFPASDLATNLKDLDLNANDKPLQRSLGLIWNVNTDNSLFQLSSEDKPATKRSILSSINSIFDPLGFLAPVTLYGKLLLRKVVSETVDWDQPLTDDIASEWKSWKDSLKEIDTLRIPRVYVPYLSKATSKELHVYSDASEKAVAAVAYLRTEDVSGTPKVGFVLGKAKVAPTSGHTIPRLELCAAVLAVEIAHCATVHLDLCLDTVKYYTDSKVILGYIYNEKRRFYVYVANRIERIRQFSDPSQWNYVPTHCNPADLGTRSILPREIHESVWIHGPNQLRLSSPELEDIHEEEYKLVNPDEDHEIRSSVTVKKTKSELTDNGYISTSGFKTFSDWKRLVCTITFLKMFARSRASAYTETKATVEIKQEAENVILRSVQREVYNEEITCIESRRSIPKHSSIVHLNPFLDENGLLRVGGRIGQSEFSLREKNPLIIPGNHHVAKLLVRHFHSQVKHQGRHFTDGAVRSAGLWITNVKRLISSVIHKCVICRKLRGKTECQIMSDLPKDRIEPSPPFTNVGVDVFGPWMVSSRRTRGGLAHSKRWAVLFTCLVTRAVHIELVEEMSSSAFINAVRRFTAIRGPVKIFRSDRGSNFIGAINDLRIDTVNIEDGLIKKYLFDSGTTWIFNPPHSSHMGGAWERLIGVARRILDWMLLNSSHKDLTHDVLNTFMAEVSAIINSRPLVPVSTDPESPLILTPSMLLTQKTEYKFNVNSLGEFNNRDMYKAEWKHVQALASVFWSRWKKEYLPLLQIRKKWMDSRRDVAVGDVVLVKDKNINRNSWPTEIITKVFESSDKHVRKVDVHVVVDGKQIVYTRPIVDLILLVEDNCL